ACPGRPRKWWARRLHEKLTRRNADMTEPRPSFVGTDEDYVSTGTLPTQNEVRALIQTAYERFRHTVDGNVADYIPALAEADPALFSLCVANTRGETFG